MIVRTRNNKCIFKTNNKGIWDIVDESSDGKPKFVLGYWINGIDNNVPRPTFLRCDEYSDETTAINAMNVVYESLKSNTKFLYFDD